MCSEVINTDYLSRLQAEVRRTLSQEAGITHAFMPNFHVNCSMMSLIRTCLNKKPDNIRFESGHPFIYADYYELVDGGTITVSAPLED